MNNDSSKKINRKPKKPRLTSSQNKNNAQSALLGTLGLEGTPNNQGLTNNHLSPIRKNNSLLDRPEVTVPVSSQFFLFKNLVINFINYFRKALR